MKLSLVHSQCLDVDLSPFNELNWSDVHAQSLLTVTAKSLWRQEKHFDKSKRLESFVVRICALSQLGQYDEVVNTLIDAQSWFYQLEDIDPKLESILLSELCYSILRLDYLNVSLLFAQRLQWLENKYFGDKSISARNALIKAHLKYYQGDYKQALSLSKAAEAYFSSLSSGLPLIRAQVLVARIKCKLNYSQAISNKSYFSAISTAELHGLWAQYIHILACRSDTEVQKRDFVNVRNTYGQYLRVCKNISTFNEIDRALIGSSRAALSNHLGKEKKSILQYEHNIDFCIANKYYSLACKQIDEIVKIYQNLNDIDALYKWMSQIDKIRQAQMQDQVILQSKLLNCIFKNTVHDYDLSIPKKLSNDEINQQVKAQTRHLYRDISIFRCAAERADILAHRDTLTGLGNRHALNKALNKISILMKKNSVTATLIFLDIDKFKSINDTFGHTVGDEILQRLSMRLRGICNGNAQLFRWAGDEFVILIYTDQNDDALKLSEDIHENLARRPETIGDESVYLSVSIGVARYPNDADDSVELLHAADVAMYRAKKSKGRRTFEYSSPTVSKKNKSSVNRPKTSLGNYASLPFEFQPWYRLADQCLYGFSLQNNTQGQERAAFGLLSNSNRNKPSPEAWVCRMACQYLKQWNDMGVQVSVNLPIAACLQTNADLGAEISQEIANLSINPASIQIDISTDLLRAPTVMWVDNIKILADIGVSLILDKAVPELLDRAEIPLSGVCLDTASIAQMGICPAVNIDVERKIQLIHARGLPVFARGITQAAQHQWLIQAGCEFGQGPRLARAAPLRSVDQWLPMARLQASPKELVIAN